MAMDQKSKNIDCYFYFYSECVRGNFCKFRHEPAALGCEDVCMKWKDGNCTEAHCSLRHMELKKKRKEIPCYWEKQPGGCRKAHCAFKHQSKSTQGELPNSPEGSNKEPETSVPDWRNAKLEGAASMESTSTPEAPIAETSRRVSQGAAESYNSSPAAVEPIVVNFEEESDSESAPSWTPTKMPKEKETLHVKTLEEIRLEKVQAESAAYWEGIAGGPMAWEAANPAANPSGSPCSIISGVRKPSNSSTNASSFKKSNINTKNVTKELDFQVLTLDEIRKNRARRTDFRNGMDNRRCNISSQAKPLINGHSNQQSEDCKSHSDMNDLRSKLSSAKPFDRSDNSNVSDTLSSKRQRQISPPSGPNKKQRIRLRRLSEMIGDKETGDKLMRSMKSDGVYEELDSDNNFLSDIDKLLMELE
ncbi:zinc finger CCCH domain-containing protein 11A-like [Thrips palmi]|uniref:Zinc finger CCCH domain-containing protein 11A-like n=1 Tax=Thrips palmi TaxID=161013 RepID=A0A6P8ZXU1_THRPL|nr:zinc finger CCCH domain-containing protein 11A-like [Thrips palmi]XP_034250223.1 zinc finger CCCH domain-containing protein 11A-like [Thrips palmi]XP_034250224.1 zinc finger CCCH domain-containing protein 11A-like [Thrips palmi]